MDLPSFVFAWHFSSQWVTESDVDQQQWSKKPTFSVYPIYISHILQKLKRQLTFTIFCNTKENRNAVKESYFKYKHTENTVAFNLAERAWTPTGRLCKSSAVTEASISVSFCRGGCQFCSSAGYRKYSLASSQFTLILGLRIRIK